MFGPETWVDSEDGQIYYSEKELRAAQAARRAGPFAGSCPRCGGKKTIPNPSIFSSEPIPCPSCSGSGKKARSWPF